MKLFKKAVSLALASVVLMGFSAGINADSSLKISSVFPDKELSKIVEAEFDLNGDGYLNSSEISKVTQIELRGVENMDGIQYLTSCKSLYLFSDVKMGCVDLRRYTNIENCYVLEATNVKTFIGSKSLKMLHINGSGITSMSLAKSLDLKYFTFEYNDTYYGDLDLSRNSKLKSIMIETVKKLDSITFPQNADVYQIICTDLPKVRNIDISTTVKFSTLQCVDFSNMNVRSYKLPGDLFMLMCFRDEYAANGKYIHLG